MYNDKREGKALPQVSNCNA